MYQTKFVLYIFIIFVFVVLVSKTIGVAADCLSLCLALVSTIILLTNYRQETKKEIEKEEEKEKEKNLKIEPPVLDIEEEPVPDEEVQIPEMENKPQYSYLGKEWDEHYATKPTHKPLKPIDVDGTGYYDPNSIDLKMMNRQRDSTNRIVRSKTRPPHKHFEIYANANDMLDREEAKPWWDN